MYGLPKAININETAYNITNDGDFRMVLDCFTALQDEELEESERIFASLIIFYEDITSVEDIYEIFGEENTQTAVQEMYKFFDCGQITKAVPQHNFKLIDWEGDSQLISSAINKVSNMEVRAVDYMHWWTFMGYYLAIGQSALSTVVGIREKIMKCKKLEDYEKQFRRNNPQYFIWNSSTVEDKEAERLIREMWNATS